MKETKQGQAGAALPGWSPMTRDGESVPSEPNVDGRAFQRMEERTFKIPIKCKEQGGGGSLR